MTAAQMLEPRADYYRGTGFAAPARLSGLQAPLFGSIRYFSPVDFLL